MLATDDLILTFLISILGNLALGSCHMECLVKASLLVTSPRRRTLARRDFLTSYILHLQKKIEFSGIDLIEGQNTPHTTQSQA